MEDISIGQRNPLSICVRGRLLSFSEPAVMGIINVTPDSFYAGSRMADGKAALECARRMLAEGAAIIDLGACSTRPGAESVSASKEYDRLRVALEAIRTELPEAVISIDTFRADVAERCVREWGADIINDIGGGTLDPEMFSTIAELQVPYVLMHTRGTPDVMQKLTDYEDVTAEVIEYLARKADELHQLGVCDVIIDPGFGFAKTVSRNFEMLGRLGEFRKLGMPILVGLSRKTLIRNTIGVTAEDALNGTTVLNTLALAQNGVDILRVHDVRPAVEAVKLTMATLSFKYPNRNPADD